MIVFLLVHAAGLALAGWAIVAVLDFRGAADVATWFVAGLLLHDLVVLPLYSGADRLLQRLRVRGVAAVNHVRVPAGLSLLSLAVFGPLIFGKSDPGLARVSGIEPSGYAGRWLLLTAGLFALSALWLAIRVQQLQDAGAAAGDEDAPGPRVD